MRRALAIAAVVLVTVETAAAQSTTAEGVDAFVRGDYQRAAAILKPIAEQAPQRDPVAAFFMAAMYDSGLGIAADPMRACALYLRASAPVMVAGRSPFATMAMSLGRYRRATLSQEAFAECTWHEQNGFDHGFEPVTFAIGHGHSIAWDIKGATITYDGKEKRIEVPFVRDRFIVLPLRYTPVAVGPTRSTYRHFIEILTWQPTMNPQEWTLMWSLMEVVRADLLRIAMTPLVTVSAPAAPADRSVDVRTLVRLDANDEGNVEWSPLVGSNRATAVIETEADRADQEQERLRARDRAAAKARIDSTRSFDLHRRPALAYEGAGWCMGTIIGESADRAETITIRSEIGLKDFASRAGPFDLSTRNGGFEVTVLVRDKADREEFCSDAYVGPRPAIEPWRATKGTLTMFVPPGDGQPRSRKVYRATIRIDGAEFVNNDGVRVVQSQPIVLAVVAR